MLGLKQRHIVAAIVGFLLVVALSSLALIYLVPAPPKSLVIATSLKGGGYEVIARRYQARFAREGIKLEILHTGGSAENIRLLEDASSGVKIGFTQGGISNSELAPDIISLGRIDYQPFWLFYSGSQKFISMRQLIGASIAVGAPGSGTQVAAKQIFEISGVNTNNSKFSPLGGLAAVEALQQGDVDAAFFAYSADAQAIKTLFANPNIHLMSMSQTEALTRIFPYLVQLKLPDGVINFPKDLPAGDVTLIGTTNAVIVRKDIHPQIVQLLLQAMVAEHKKPGIFERVNEFPTPIDPEFEVDERAVDFYRNGSSFLYRHLPFWMVTHVQRLAALLFAVVAILLPLFNYVPKLFRWLVNERLMFFYRRLRAVENEIHRGVASIELEILSADLESMDRAMNMLAVPMRYSNLYFSIKVHINLVRTRLAAQRTELARQEAKVG